MKRRICVVVTARPTYSRIRSALQAIAGSEELELQLVVGASALLHDYGHAVSHISDDGFDIAAKAYMVLEGENPTAMAKTAGIGLVELSTIFDNLKPDFVVTVADRYETIATALASSYMNIPTVHVQGGEVTGSIDEKVRHAVTKLADYHFVCTDLARQNVLRMGEDPSTVFNTGCPSIDLAGAVLQDPDLDFDPVEKYGGVGAEADLSNGYIVVLQHPVTTEYEDARAQITETLEAVRDLEKPVLWFWPNPDAGSDGTSEGIRAFREQNPGDRIHFFKNMGPVDFLKLLVNCDCIAGNSSVAIRECAYLGVPAVNVGTRQLGRERGRNVIDVGYERGEIRAAIDKQLTAPRPERDLVYGDIGAGERIAELLARIEPRVDKRLTY